MLAMLGNLRLLYPWSFPVFITHYHHQGLVEKNQKRDWPFLSPKMVLQSNFGMCFNIVFSFFGGE